MHTKKRGKKLAVAAAACLVAAGLFLLRPGQVEDKMPNNPKPPAAALVIPKTTQSDSAAVPIQRANTKPTVPAENLLLKKTRQEFPYESLNCELITEKENQEWVQQFSGEASFKLMCSSGFSILGFGSEVSRELCPTELTKGIDRLKENNNLADLLAILTYLDDLNTVWTEGDFINTLLFVYLMPPEFYDNHWTEEGSHKQYSWNCIFHVSYAIKLRFLAAEAISEMLLENPFDSEYVLSNVSEELQKQIFYIWAYEFFKGERPVLSALDSFFDSFSSDRQEQFISAFDNLLVDERPSLEFAQRVAEYSKHPRLRSKVRSLLPSWEKEVAEAEKEEAEVEKIMDEFEAEEMEDVETDEFDFDLSP